MAKTTTDCKDPNQCYEILREKVIKQHSYDVMPFLQRGLASWIMSAENHVACFERPPCNKNILSHHKHSNYELVHILATMIIHHQKEYSHDSIRATF